MIKNLKQPKQEQNIYTYGKKYRFRIVNEYGWDMRINSILNEATEGVLYHMYLLHSLSISSLYINLKKSELKISGDCINIKFKCKSILEAENLIDIIK
jgi:hypothetical protein